MDMPEVEDTNMVEYGHPMNHRLGQDGMNMMDEHDHLMNHRLGEEGMNMAGIHMVEERPSNHRSEVEGIDREDSDMVEVDVVEREHEGVVLMMHWIDDLALRHQRARRK
jgi:hypothetical protein